MGVIKGSFSIGKYLLVFGLGIFVGYSYRKFIEADDRYDVTRISRVPYLVDKVSKERLVILEDEFQVGSLEHRVEGILRDPNLVKSIENLRRRYEK